MRRKILLHGPSSLTTSLPSSWVKKNNIKKGDEVEVIEGDIGLIINPANKNYGIKKAEIKFTGMDNDTQKDVLLALHNKGYDEARLVYDDTGASKRIQLLLNELNIGFEIVNQGSDSVVIESVLIPESEQLDKLFRRGFRIAIEYSKKIHAIMMKKEDITDSCLSHRTSIARIAALSKRIIVRENKADSHFIFLIVTDFEAIAHNLSLILDEIKETGKTFSEKFIYAFEETALMLAKSHDLYYNFDFNEYSSIRNASRQLGLKIKECKGTNDAGLSCWEYLEAIRNRIDNLSCTTLAVKI